MAPRGIAVVDVGYTNAKVILFDAKLAICAERKLARTHMVGAHYKELDLDAVTAFAENGLRELDTILPIDTIVVCGHGACIVTLNADGSLAVPVMDYMAEPPPDIVRAYAAVAPSFSESYCPQLPVALLHAMQLFWQQHLYAKEFAEATTILPSMQYIAMRLGARAVTEVSGMGCQSHLLNLNTLEPSALAESRGWARKFAPRANAWDVIGRVKGLRGRGEILAGVHDSNANFLRYLAGGLLNYTLLSTGTWIISFDTDADVKHLDPKRDIVANVSVMGKTVACSRFFGGKEYEMISNGDGTPDLGIAKALVRDGVMALPSFTDSGGPMPGTSGKGRFIGEASSPDERATLASLYCALMVSESLDALNSKGDLIVDGPFSQNPVFLSLLATLRPGQRLRASNLKDGTAAGAACLALMPEGLLPHIDITMAYIDVTKFDGLDDYQKSWQKRSADNV